MTYIVQIEALADFLTDCLGRIREKSVVSHSRACKRYAKRIRAI